MTPGGRAVAGAAARATALGVVAAALAACSGQVTPSSTSSNALGTQPADLDRDIFLPGCAFGACHGVTRPAARLDLGRGICEAMLTRPSCLFPGKQLVVPGHPEQSFLIDKLTGQNLAAKPETDCATTGNARMPYGGAPLPEETIERVRAWIRGGASCPPGDAQGGGAGGAGGSSGATAIAPGGTGGAPDTGSGGSSAPGGWRLAFDAAPPRLQSGARATLTLIIAPAAGATGLSVVLSPDDATSLGVPGAVFIPAGADRVSFDVQGKRPNPAVHLTATAEDARVETVVAIDGLYLTEVFFGAAVVASPGDHGQWVKLVNVTGAPIDLAGYQLAAGRGAQTDTTLPLTGLLDPGRCLVVGGPGSAADFEPDLPRVDPAQAGVTVAIVPAPSPAPAHAPADSLPLDALTAGGGAAITSLALGHSLVRAGASSWVDQPRPIPAADDCPRWW